MSNLLPENEKNAIARLYRKRFVAVALGILACLMLASVALLLPSLFLSKKAEAILLAKKNSISAQETSELERSLSASIGDINGRLGAFNDTLPKAPLSKHFLSAVLNAKATSIAITNFSYTTSQKSPSEAAIEISGIATNRESLLSFAARLEKIEGIASVTVPISSFLKNSDVSFTITATLAMK